MDEESPTLVEDQGEMSVRRWRRQQLEAAGFSEFTAFRIAMRFDIDYRSAIALLAKGATETQVADLLLD